MAIELVTGHAGQGHVSSADAGRLNAGVCGTGKYVLNTGLKFAYSIESANLIRIASGDAVNQGRHITIPQNTYEDANILNGTQGKTRIDVITLRYAKVTRQVDSQTVTVEEASVNVIKGTEVAAGSTPEVPAVVSGNIFDGATTDDMPLYHVLITDTSVTSVTPVFTVMPTIGNLEQNTDGLYQDILALQGTAQTHGVDLAKVKNLLGDGPLDTASQTVVGAIAEINGKLPQYIERTVEFTSIGVNANASYSATRSIAYEGYTPKNIRGYKILNNDTNGKNAGWCVFQKMWLEGNSLEFSFWNQHRDQQAVVKVRFRIEYVKN